MNSSTAYAANVPRFLITRALYNFMLFLPIWVIFVQRKHGLDLIQVTLLDSAFWLTMALTEIPTGAVADAVGRKQSYGIGLVLSVFGILMFALAGSFPLLLVANSLWALALTFISGADLAFFYDTLRVLGRESEYPRFRSIIATVDVVAAGIGGVLGGWLFTWRPESPFVLYALLLLPALALLLTFREPPRESDAHPGPETGFGGILATAARTIRAQPILRSVLVYSNLLPAAGGAIGITLIQPHVVAIGMPVEALGVILLAFNAVRVVGSASAPRLQARLGDWRLLLAAPVLVVLGVVGIGAAPGVTGLVVFGLAVYASAAARPVIESILMSETPSRVRATILSVDSLIFRLLLAGLSPFAGFVAEETSLQLAFVLMGVGSGILLAANLWFWRRAKGKLAGL